jgi:hypothetical protein
LLPIEGVEMADADPVPPKRYVTFCAGCEKDFEFTAADVQQMPTVFRKSAGAGSAGGQPMVECPRCKAFNEVPGWIP